jgi:hypothetical protein
MGEVAVVAGGDVVVAGFGPGVVFIIHDMAIDAHFGIAGEVGEAFGVAEGVEAEAQGDAEEDGGEQGAVEAHGTSGRWLGRIIAGRVWGAREMAGGW